MGGYNLTGEISFEQQQQCKKGSDWEREDQTPGGGGTFRHVLDQATAGRVAEVPFGEDNAVEGSRELKVHCHSALFARDVQTRDHWHVAGLLSFLTKTLNLPIAPLRHE